MAKLKAVPVSLKFWQQAITHGAVTCAKCIDGLPEGAQLVYSYFDGERQTAMLVFEHDDFDDLAIGAVIPPFIPTFEVL